MRGLLIINISWREMPGKREKFYHEQTRTNTNNKKPSKKFAD